MPRPAAFLLALLLVFACYRPGGGGSEHLPPPGLREGSATPLRIAFSAWGAGSGALDTRFTGVRLHYRVGSTAPFTPVTGQVDSLTPERLVMAFELPAVGVVGDTVQYFFDFTFDGHFQSRDTALVPVRAVGAP